MLKINLSPSGSYCDGVSRRNFLQIGTLAIGGLTLTLLAELRRPDVPCDTPDANGAFYFFTRVRTSLDSMTVAERLIREHKVAAMPGSAFGATDGCYLRISYGMLDDVTATEGLRRLTNGLRALAL